MQITHVQYLFFQILVKLHHALYTQLVQYNITADIKMHLVGSFPIRR